MMTSKVLTALSLVIVLRTTATFAQSRTKTLQQDTTKSERIFRFVDQQAQPKGGIHRFQKYLSKHVHYPKLAKDNNIHGRVVVQFAVNKDGKLSDFVILKDIGAGCGATVKKAIEECPYSWTPGKTSGQPVKSYFVVPFTFSL